MPSSLRERRRRQTARELQRATLTLALVHGLENVTTGMVTRQAGVSPRTFFNYFPNKESAILGHPPRFDEADLAVFAAGKGPLLSDLRQFLGKHMEQVEPDRDMLRGLLHLAAQNDRVRRLHETLLVELHEDMTRALRARLATADEMTLRLMAETLMSTCRMAIDDWLESDSDRIAPSIDRVWSRLHALAVLLSA